MHVNVVAVVIAVVVLGFGVVAAATAFAALALAALRGQRRQDLDPGPPVERDDHRDDPPRHRKP